MFRRDDTRHGEEVVVRILDSLSEESIFDRRLIAHEEKSTITLVFIVWIRDIHPGVPLLFSDLRIVY